MAKISIDNTKLKLKPLTQEEYYVSVFKYLSGMNSKDKKELLDYCAPFENAQFLNTNLNIGPGKAYKITDDVYGKFKDTRKYIYDPDTACYIERATGRLFTRKCIEDRMYEKELPDIFIYDHMTNLEWLDARVNQMRVRL